VPEFLLTLTRQREAGPPSARPLALLGPDERVCAASASARAAGVLPEMRPAQALARCPDLGLLPCDMRAAQEAQAALLDILAEWALPVETVGWGAAYLDLRPVAQSGAAVQPLAAELGRHVRQALGRELQPALGWDSGKFTARAAAARAAAGRMRLVDKAEEVAFLAPLSITLLPLAPAALQQLHWLGIRTLGQFGRLPAAAVWQRLGRAGKLAQQWAQGRDDRPVYPTLSAPPLTLDVALDPPTGLLPPLLAALEDALLPPLHELSATLRGISRLRITLQFVMGETRTLDLAVVTPIGDTVRLSELLAAQLSSVNWPGEVSAARVVVTATAELPIRQLTLLPDMEESPAPLADVAQALAGRYGAIFFQAEWIDERHPVTERRTRLHAMP
jgi:protein ImuB